MSGVELEKVFVVGVDRVGRENRFGLHDWRDCLLKFFLTGYCVFGCRVMIGTISSLSVFAFAKQLLREILSSVRGRARDSFEILCWI